MPEDFGSTGRGNVRNMHCSRHTGGCRMPRTPRSRMRLVDPVQELGAECGQTPWGPFANENRCPRMTPARMLEEPSSGSNTTKWSPPSTEMGVSSSSEASVPMCPLRMARGGQGNLQRVHWCHSPGKTGVCPYPTGRRIKSARVGCNCGFLRCCPPVQQLHCASHPRSLQPHAPSLHTCTHMPTPPFPPNVAHTWS